MSDTSCHCLIKHANTPEERRAVIDALDHARRIGDSMGITVALAQLDNSSCPANSAQQKANLRARLYESGEIDDSQAVK